MESKKDDIRKGPWKAEEDELLINHVKEYGPREWSSIRSTGFLKRTGKSCRLRWVNKLRPNLKKGCKFTAEEERVVIELQSQFGNKWANIATFLPGRTDNDVKNFWSSRQKRLARILQASASTPSSSNLNLHKAKKQVTIVRDFNCLKVPSISSYSMEEESSTKAHPCSSSFIENATPQPLAMVQLHLATNLIKQEMSDFDTNLIQVETQPQLPFHQIPQPELAFSPESPEVLARLEDPYPFNVFGAPETGPQFPLGPPFFNPASTEFQNPETLDIFLDDLPTDMFHNIEQLPSP